MYSLLIRKIDKGKRDFIFLREIDLAAAIEFYESYDWNEDFQKIKKRKSNRLSSVYPAIILQEDKNNRLLIITSDEDGNIIIDYESGNYENSFSIAANAEFNNENENVQSIITRFFNNDIEQYESSGEVNYAEYYPKLGKNRAIDYFFIYFRFPLIFVFFLFVIISENFDLISFVAFIFIIVAVSDIPILYTLFDYHRKEGTIKYIQLNKSIKQIEIHYSVGIKTIRREDIKKCVLNFSPSSKTSPYFANLVILLYSNEEFVFTTLTFTEGELNVIVNFLDLPLYSREKWIAGISSQTPDDKIEMDKSLLAKEKDLNDLYENYSDEKLKEILKNKEDYQELAVKVAERELQKRISTQ